MRTYVHVHRADRPGKCYWVSDVGDGVSGLHPDFAMADTYAATEVPALAVSLCRQFEVPMEFVQVPVDQPSLIPAEVRELLNL